MILTIPVQLVLTSDQKALLRQTISVANAAATWLASQATAASAFSLQKEFYSELRERFGLPAQMACLCCRRVAAALKISGKRRPKFRPEGAIPLDSRLLTLVLASKTVSIATLSGRMKVPFLAGETQIRQIETGRVKESDLVLRSDGKAFLLISVDLPVSEVIPVRDIIGVDMGVANIATTSTGRNYCGNRREAHRLRYARRQRRLQKQAAEQKADRKRPKNVRRALKRASGKQAQYQKNENHCISKELVALAKGTNCAVALENLEGVRTGKRFRRPQRARLGNWSYGQLRAFVVYKAILAGVPVIFVDPRNTSRECDSCGHTDKKNRKTQSEFLCLHCGHSDHADRNAAKIIRKRALVNAPMVAEKRSA